MKKLNRWLLAFGLALGHLGTALTAPAADMSQTLPLDRYTLPPTGQIKVMMAFNMSGWGQASLF